MAIGLFLLVGIPALVCVGIIIGIARGEPLLEIHTYEWEESEDDTPADGQETGEEEGTSGTDSAYVDQR